MALIKCPNCGQDISDKADVCIHCGAVLKAPEPKPERMCPDCGAVIEDETITVCPKCGCPLDNKSIEKPQEEHKEEQTAINKIFSNKKNIRIIIGVACIIIIGIIATIIGIQVKKQETAKALKEAADKQRSDYSSNLTTVNIYMVKDGISAGKICGMVSSIWHDSIFKNYYNADTMDYVTSDFNKSIEKYYKASSTISDISTIKEDNEEVTSLMKKLQNPPDEFEDCYDTLNDLYNAYTKLTSLAISPTGNYNEYTDNVNSYVDDFVAAEKKLETQIPDLATSGTTSLSTLSTNS